MTALGRWQNFYVIVGSSAGALIGLQFVVMALVADMPRTALADPTECLFGVATAALLLLFIGIHNAWDAVTYHVFVIKPKHDQAEQSRWVSNW